MNAEEYIKKLKESECRENGHDMISPQDLRCSHCGLDLNSWFLETFTNDTLTSKIAS